MAELPLDRGEVALAERVPQADTDPRTEVGQVGLALNRLLGHVGAALEARQSSETRLGRFVADASHELRTPLAAIRGYAELTRRSSEPVPPDIAHMLAMVEDLMLLARLDAGRPLGRDPVALSRLVVDAMSDAHAVSPDHRWQLTAPDEEVTVTGDAASLAQVLANLLANARTHTPPGTTVSVTLIPVDGQVTLSVMDDGPGVPPDLLPHVFERFARRFLPLPRQRRHRTRAIHRRRRRRCARRLGGRHQHSRTHRLHRPAIPAQLNRSGRHFELRGHLGGFLLPGDSLLFTAGLFRVAVQLVDGRGVSLRALRA